jgi:ArsR family transcriptional regulator, arsenate/arsenite/antimonite-responsive transcriptional repressor
MGHSPRTLASVHKALADETRIQMLALLLERRELCVCHLERSLDITQSKASRHLRYLLNAGLLQDRREGVWMHYRLAEDMAPELRALVETIGTTLDPAVLEGLKERLGASLCCAAPAAR